MNTNLELILKKEKKKNYYYYSIKVENKKSQLYFLNNKSLSIYISPNEKNFQSNIILPNIPENTYYYKSSIDDFTFIKIHDYNDTIIIIYTSNYILKGEYKNLNLGNDFDNNKTPRGLYNIGSTCFMNSILQCLFSIKVLKEFLLNNNFKKQSISYGLKEVFLNLNQESYEAYSPYNFKSILEYNNKLFMSTAGDPSDLIIDLLDKLHEENKNEINSINDKTDQPNNEYLDCDEQSIISDNLYTYIKEKSKCSSCSKLSFNIEPKFLIEFNLETVYNDSKFNNYTNGIITIDECFEAYYGKKSITTFYCDYCKKMKKSQKISIFERLPEILVIILKRKKIGDNIYEHKVKIEENLNLSKYSEDTHSKYNFLAASTIAYTPSYGHYGHAISFCRHNKEYYKFNDSSVSYINFKDFNCMEHYILFYEKN